MWVLLFSCYLPLANCANFCCRAANAACMFWFTSTGMTRAGTMTLGGMVTDAVVEVVGVSPALGCVDFCTYNHTTTAAIATAKMIAPEMMRKRPTGYL